jgi:5-methyltetrahydropteroyltriglutamate--homocysteine methyltransferase
MAPVLFSARMQRSVRRVLATHVGSLPGVASFDPAAPGYEEKVRAGVAEVVRRQRDAGLDVINEGEYSKGGDWLSYVDGRFAGFESRTPRGTPVILQGKDREEFADFYRYATERGTLFYSASGDIKTKREHWVCTGPIAYRGQAAVRREIELLKSQLGPGEEGFLTATAPASLEPYWANEYYKSEGEFLFAFAEALRVEYELIASSGLVLQVDDAWLPAMWDRVGIPMGLEAFRKRCVVRVEALNHALRNIPEERVRYHLCWGSWHGPHAYDIEMRHMVDIMLRVKAQAYLFEAANARHEHEYVVWDDVKLPEGKILVPGVVTHSTDVVEHPELVAQRIGRFAERVGRSNVMAGCDCGFGGRSHPQIAWAKLKSLADGTRIASRTLGFAH